MKARKNKKVSKKQSVIAASTGHMAIIIMSVFCVVIMNILAASSCNHLHKTIGEEERELARLEDACRREETRWEEMKTPEKIEEALRRHGLAMKPPRPDQIVHMTSQGAPYPGQISVARAKKRASMNMASLSTVSTPRRALKGRR
jgi:hypothetical protein